ncbi:hypothetical protein N7454_006014 [Penicillium verhagenii]|nr:hypothetical protein N7454_006014 [Penicillium verhagenii]
MGVMRMPRPTGIYVPASPIRLTPEMISPPLSPDFNFDSEAVLPTIFPALEYISTKLQQRMMHVTLLVGRGKPFPTGQASDLLVIPITKLDQASTRVLERAIAKGARKFSLGTSWSEALDRSQHERLANEYLVQQSILQNEVLFSQEGLTLLNLDRIYTFKRRLCVLSTRPNPRPEDKAMTSAVALLHRLMTDFQSRSFSKAFFHRVYEQLDVRDELLTAIASAYKNTHKTDAIILPTRFTAENSKSSPIRLVRVRKIPPPTKTKSSFYTKRGPKTPLSASDVTPITRNEWNMLVGQDIHELQPTVTKWIPSATVYVGA